MTEKIRFNGQTIAEFYMPENDWDEVDDFDTLFSDSLIQAIDSIHRCYGNEDGDLIEDACFSAQPAYGITMDDIKESVDCYTPNHITAAPVSAYLTELNTICPEVVAVVRKIDPNYRKTDLLAIYGICCLLGIK